MSSYRFNALWNLVFALIALFGSIVWAYFLFSAFALFWFFVSEFSKYYLITYQFDQDGHTGIGSKVIKGELDINEQIYLIKQNYGFDEVVITYAKHITKREYENFNK